MPVKEKSRPVELHELGVIEVFAAGGVVWRRGRGKKIEVLLVHRLRYDDWSIPKGKRDPEETDEECALREVEEETGLRCKLGPELATSQYVDRKGRNKLVRYWAMTVGKDTGFTPGEEIDERRWAGIGKARKLVSYAADVVILDAFEASVTR